MRHKKIRLILGLLPVALVLMVSSCSSGSSEEVTKSEEEVTEKPLVEREPQVKEFFEVMNTMVDECFTLGETVLESVERLDAGKLGLLESAATLQELYESWDKIDEINASLKQQDRLKENLTAKLNPKDLLEFKGMYEASVARMDTIMKRLEAMDVEKYLK